MSLRDLEEEESLNSEEIVQSEQIIEEAQTETWEDTPLEANSWVIENDETIENTAEDKEFNEENIENEMNESEEIEWEDSYEWVQVHVYAQEWAFPKWTTLEINPIKEKAAISDIQDIIEEQQEIERTEKLIAFDITFLYSWEEIQPVEWKTVQVTFNYENNNILKAAEENEDQEVKVYHLNDIDDNWEKIEEIKETKVEDVEINEEKSEEENVIVVDAESFSVYTIVVQVIEEQLINFEYWEISIEDPEHPWTWITIMDRNLWAKVAWTGDSSYGYYYQWWNNYWFPTMGNVATSSDPVNVSDLNSYSWSTFRSGYSWMSEPNNFVLWIWDNKQWPCPEWWHIPTIQEWNQLVDYYIKANYPDVELSTDPTGNKHIDNGIVAKWFSNKFYIPRAGYRKYL